MREKISVIELENSLFWNCEVKNMNCVIHKNVANVHIGKTVTSNNRGGQFNLTDGKTICGYWF